jgi:Ca2+-binding EF-hand superfamily protein
MGIKQTKNSTSHKNANLILSEEDLCYILCNSNYTREQIKEWHESFIITCPQGYLTRKTFVKMFKECHKYGKVDKLCNRLFDLFDGNHNGKIEFWEFMLIISLAGEIDFKKRLSLVFKLYDINQNGRIEKKELEIIISYIYDFFGYDKTKEKPSKRAKEILLRLDKDQNGYLDENEFIDGCLRDPIMNGLFSGFFEKFFIG